MSAFDLSREEVTKSPAVCGLASRRPSLAPERQQSRWDHRDATLVFFFSLAATFAFFLACCT
jgi:hypothetical protein